MEKNEWYLEVNYSQIMPRDSGKLSPNITNYSNENKGSPPKKTKMQSLWINVWETLLNKWFCIRWRNSCASLVAQMVKNLPAMQETRVQSLGKIPWKREWQPTPVFLPREFHGQRSLAGYSQWGPKESDMTEQLTHREITRRLYYKLGPSTTCPNRWETPVI